MSENTTLLGQLQYLKQLSDARTYESNVKADEFLFYYGVLKRASASVRSRKGEGNRRIPAWWQERLEALLKSRVVDIAGADFSTGEAVPFLTLSERLFLEPKLAKVKLEQELSEELPEVFTPRTAKAARRAAGVGDGAPVCGSCNKPGHVSQLCPKNLAHQEQQRAAKRAKLAGGGAGRAPTAPPPSGNVCEVCGDGHRSHKCPLRNRGRGCFICGPAAPGAENHLVEGCPKRWSVLSGAGRGAREAEIAAQRAGGGQGQ